MVHGTFLMVVSLALAGSTGLALANEPFPPNEAYMSQAPARIYNPAFLKQLPETALERPSSAAAPRKRLRRNVNAKHRMPSARATARSGSVFPSVERGVTAAFPSADGNFHFPSVGPGTIGK